LPVRSVRKREERVSGRRSSKMSSMLTRGEFGLIANTTSARHSISAFRSIRLVRSLGPPHHVTVIFSSPNRPVTQGGTSLGCPMYLTSYPTTARSLLSLRARSYHSWRFPQGRLAGAVPRAGFVGLDQGGSPQSALRAARSHHTNTQLQHSGAQPKFGPR